MSKAAELAALIGGQKALGDKNLIINGEMQVAQRGTSLAMAHDGTTSSHLIDRWRFSFGGSHGQLDGTYAQVADHPLTANGKSLKWTTGTAESSYDASEYLYFVQIIEAQNLQRLQFGNSNAKSVTLSFYVKSSITGTYAVNLYKPDSTIRIINKTYTISSASTWEKKTITFPADTDSGAGIVNDNGQGFYVSWHLAAGSSVKGNGSLDTWKDYAGLSDWADGQDTNAVATTASATWQITQCQLEIGDVATAFEHRSVADDFIACQRYYQIGAFLAGSGSSSNFRTTVSFSTPMRAQPTLSTPSDAFKVTDGYASEYASTDANPAWVTYFQHQGGVVGTSNHASVSGDARRGTMHANNVSGVVAVDNLEMDSEL